MVATGRANPSGLESCSPGLAPNRQAKGQERPALGIAVAAAPSQGGTAGISRRGPRRDRLRHPRNRQQAVGADGLGLAGLARIGPWDGADLGMGIPPPEGALHHKR